ncbi:MAG: ribonuclease P protein component [Candidatus Ancaeobacter aquaticus]|nr:ribonuclease P protein component [Candidatus Ancaeobacter aquaticus]
MCPAEKKALSRCTFRKHERLVKQKEFKDIITHGKKFATQHILYYIKKNELPYNRLGVSISRKTGNAVVRNRCKRRIRELFRTHKKEIAQGFDICTVIIKDIGSLKHEELKTAYINMLHKIAARFGEDKS